jgi:hypothetical protein
MVSITTTSLMDLLHECPADINFLDCRRKIANVLAASDCQFNSSQTSKLS